MARIGLQYHNDINGPVFFESFGAPLVLSTNASLIQFTFRNRLWYLTLLGTEVRFLSSFSSLFEYSRMVFFRQYNTPSLKVFSSAFYCLQGAIKRCITSPPPRLFSVPAGFFLTRVISKTPVMQSLPGALLVLANSWERLPYSGKPSLWFIHMTRPFIWFLK